MVDTTRNRLLKTDRRPLSRKRDLSERQVYDAPHGIVGPSSSVHSGRLREARYIQS